MYLFSCTTTLFHLFSITSDFILYVSPSNSFLTSTFYFFVSILYLNLFDFYLSTMYFCSVLNSFTFFTSDTNIPISSFSLPIYSLLMYVFHTHTIIEVSTYYLCFNQHLTSPTVIRTKIWNNSYKFMSLSVQYKLFTIIITYLKITSIYMA